MIPNLRALFRNSFGVLSLAAAWLPAAVLAAEFVPDQGFYRVYQNDHLLGVERISFEQHGDSLVVISTVRQRLPRGTSQQDTLAKTAMLVLGLRDRAWRSYQSYEQLNGDNLSRILSVEDKAYTSYRQGSEGGFGDTYELPPGRVYVVDPQVFAVFDVLCRDLHTQHFEERPVSMIYIMARDTTVTARVRRLGTEPFKLGKQTISAEKFSITDPWSQFFAWASPSGRMLRLTLPVVGLRVERDPESLKPKRITKSSLPPAPGLPTVIMGPTPKAFPDPVAPPGR